MSDSIHFSLTANQLEIYTKYSGLALPRHTSYPIAALWTEEYNHETYKTQLQELGNSRDNLSLYIHVPFCEQLCFYCACNKEVLGKEKLKKGDPRDLYLQNLEKEMIQVSSYLQQNPVKELHFGGGTPTFLTDPQMEKLLDLIHKHFRFTPDFDFSVEIDPRVTTEEQIKYLVSRGMTRVSLGVQDFNEKVQQAINRLQSFELVKNVTEICRANGIKSVNFDLIYGLPFQSMETMMSTLDSVFTLSPDRIAFYRLAVIPDMFKWQKSFTKHDLLKDEKLLEINMKCINRFQENGYHFIGLDHFAKNDESLAQSEQQGTLRRNFQGMTTGGSLSIVGLGPSAISQLPMGFAQNPKKNEDWMANIDEHGLATERGMALNSKDKLIQETISQLYCYGAIDKKFIEQEFQLTSFDQEFASELNRLKDLESEDIVTVSPTHIQLTPVLGRLLVRAVASVFDRFLPENAYKEGINPNHASRLG